MGIEYSLVNYRTKEMIDLGKGCWWGLVYSPENLLYREGIEEVLQDSGYFDNQTQDMITYWYHIIDMIWNFVKNEDPSDITIVSDSGDETYILRCYGYRYIASRYISNTVDNLEFLNRHLEPESKKRYKLEDCKQYIRKTCLNPVKLST